MMLVAALALMLAQSGEHVDQTPDMTGKGLLVACGDYNGRSSSPTAAMCVSYVTGLMDGIANYEAAIKVMRFFDDLIHAGFFARVGELPTEFIDGLRGTPSSANIGEGLAKTQAAAVAKGTTRGTKLLPPFYDQVNRSAAQPQICLPDGASSEQLTLVIVKFLKDHPERLHEERGILAMGALRAAFPCADRGAKASASSDSSSSTAAPKPR